MRGKYLMSNSINDQIIDSINDEVYLMSREDKINYLKADRDYIIKDINNMNEKELFIEVVELMWENHPDYIG